LSLAKLAQPLAPIGGSGGCLSGTSARRRDIPLASDNQTALADAMPAAKSPAKERRLRNSLSGAGCGSQLRGVPRARGKARRCPRGQRQLSFSRTCGHGRRRADSADLRGSGQATNRVVEDAFRSRRQGPSIHDDADAKIREWPNVVGSLRSSSRRRASLKSAPRGGPCCEPLMRKRFKAAGRRLVGSQGFSCSSVTRRRSADQTGIRL